MKELTIHHIPAQDELPARVRVAYRKQVGSQPQERESEFKFAVSDEERRLIQWYLEEYLLFPWGEFRNRANVAEETMTWLGEQLFEAIFDNREMAALYAHVADHLAATRVVIHASDPLGISLP